ncbi:MAG: putative integral rane protein [Thermoleophilia bacterium]|nr:putative integral rane protein [Thermoleophilia bacterium]
MSDTATISQGRGLLNRVPEVTVFFWLIKLLAVTVGETAADYLAGNLGMGLANTTYLMTAILAVVLIFQFSRKRYVAGPYWLAVTMVSIVGTLITDNLTDRLEVSLYISTAVFAVALAAVFAIWHAREGTLSIHTIYTTRREAFYWLAVLLTFALGTAGGDLLSEEIGLGYVKTGLLFLVGIAIVTGMWKLGANAIGMFWAAYIMTRPLGASLGDFMSQPGSEGGLGLGTTGTSIIFLLAILTLVIYLSVTKVDRTELRRGTDADVLP